MMQAWGIALVLIPFVAGCIFLVIYTDGYANEGKAKIAMTVIIVLGGLLFLADGFYMLHAAGYF